MGHIRDCISYSHGAAITRGCFVTGKPVILGGIVGRREATGKGVVYSVLAACQAVGLDITACRVAIHGFGNVGSHTARLLAEQGVKIIGISDISTAIHNPDGIDVQDVEAYLKKNKVLEGYDKAQHIRPKEKVLELKTDILVPAALENQITSANAGNVDCRFIVEGANGPTTPDADRILKKKGILVIPDILANAGGVTASYYEWVQNVQREQWPYEKVVTKLEKKLVQAYNDVRDLAEREDVDMRIAAYMIAIGRVAKATEARGVFP
ncbi:MAG: glutamate dehydrogenase, partial [Candidatus Undinarchaeales archaeon]|nr:glutamate dehydrogenase [Candidatus Undinarchaeales archaeon]